MPIYWTFLILPLALKAIFKLFEEKSLLFQNKDKNERFIVVALFALIIFFAGMRSYVADSHIYARSYMWELPNTLSAFRMDDYDRDWFFYFLSTVFKVVTKGSYNAWFMAIAAISGYYFGRAVIRYSEYKWLSCYLFVAGNLFSYFFNGMRQFIAMAVLMGCIGLLLEKKYVKFILLIAFLAQIHGSAWFFIIVIFLQRCEPWSKMMGGVVVLSLIAGLCFDSLTGVMDTVLENTQYAGMGAEMASGEGSSVIRVLVDAVPVVLAWIGREQIRHENNTFIDLCVNCSIMNMALMILSTFSFGIYMGRVAIYFGMFNIFLLPWLLFKLTSGKNTKIIVAAFIAVYGLYFFYQMEIAWNGWPYVSDVLNLKFLGRNIMDLNNY